MRYLDRLLDGVEIEWKPLGEVADLKRGTTITKNTSTEGKYPVISGGQQPAYYIDKYNRDGETITVAGSGAYAGFLMYWNEPIFVSDAFSIIINKSQVSSRYIYHFLLNIQDKIYCLKSGGGVPHVYAKDVARFLIPIPCPDNTKKSLEIQTEIVRILDQFSTLTAELQAELQARKSQYEYYRDQLLDYPMEESGQPSLRSSRSAASIQISDNSSSQQSAWSPLTDNSVLQPRGKVEWKTLGEIGTLTIGRRFVRTDIQESGVPCFHYGDLYTYYGISATKSKGYLSDVLAKKLRFAEPNDVIIVCAGENDTDIGVGVAWLGNEPAVVHDACCILHHNQNPKYISHFLRTHNYHIQIKKYVKNGKISSLPVSGLKNAVIPIPSLAEQARIVAILDKFDTLTTSISEGLPKEIKLRQKQYEYYRNMLLSFPKDKIKA